MKHFILATAGHVDHGKTALVKALTGVDTDRLPEEKARGITIDLGFAHLALPGLSFGVIDVPGHEDFMRNMIAGLGAIDLALLVVAADDGWMPQTEEHWQILHYLGVRHGVVAITKCDLGDAARTVAAVREQLGRHSLGEIADRAHFCSPGTGLEELKRTLDGSVRGASSRAGHRKAALVCRSRLYRAWHRNGRDRHPERRAIEARRNVLLQPQNLRARVRAIQSHNQPLEVALPATRTAINLPDLRPEDIPRGSVLTTLETEEASRTIDVLLERAGLRFAPAEERVADSDALRQRALHGPDLLLDRRELSPGEKAIARLRFTKPVFVFVGDRFILRDSSGRDTIAGGIVLDPDAEGTKFRSPSERTFLQARAAAPNELSTSSALSWSAIGWSQRESLLLKSNFSEANIVSSDRAPGSRSVKPSFMARSWLMPPGGRRCASARPP